MLIVERRSMKPVDPRQILLLVLYDGKKYERKEATRKCGCTDAN